jgi:hypothetical protein
VWKGLRVCVCGACGCADVRLLECVCAQYGLPKSIAQDFIGGIGRLKTEPMREGK